MMNFNLRNNFILLFLAALLCAGRAAGASLSVTPESQVITVKHGKKAVGSIIVKNTMAGAVRIDVQPELRDRQGREIQKAVPWLMISPKSFALAAGGQRKVKLTAAISDESVLPSLTYIFFAFRDRQDKSRLSVGMRIGSIVQWKAAR